MRPLFTFLFLFTLSIAVDYTLTAQTHKTLRDSSTVIIFSQNATSTYKKKSLPVSQILLK
jgi:hypothetical protein